MKRSIIHQAWNTKTGKISALLLASFLIIALSFGGCTIAKSTQPTEQDPTPVTNGAATAAFQISKLLIYPERGYSGQEVVIMAAVTNTGGGEGEYIAELQINNIVEEQKKITLPAREAKVLNFSTYKFDPGTYNVSLGGLTGQFEVLDPFDQAAVIAPSTGSTGCTGCGPAGASTGQAGGGCCGGGTTNSPTARVQAPRGGCGCGGR
jgi:hypothetical protein